MNQSYVDLLKQEFLDRKERRPQYSERAFARDLDLSSSFISLLFHGKRSLSPRTSLNIIKKLNWPEQRGKAFLESVQAAKLLEKPNDKKPNKEIKALELELDQFRLISNVVHLAIIEYIQAHNVPGIDSIAKYFDLNTIDCELMVKRLLRLKLIFLEKGKYQVSAQNRKVNDIPSQAIRNYHKQILELAQDSIETQSFDERELRGLTLSIDPKRMKQAKAQIQKFVKTFNRNFGGTKKGSIYQMNVQLFQLGDFYKESE